MTQRINYMQQSPELFKKFIEFSNLIKDSSIEESIRDLVAIRASQLNGCGFCVDMHVKQAKIHGERELRLHHLAIWRESTLFIPRERAALAWAEAVTKVTEGYVPDEVYVEARKQFTEEELIDITMAVVGVNSYNRINIAFRIKAGTYKPGEHAVLAK